MPNPRPKILSVVTIPTGGWVVTLYVDSDGNDGEDYDEKIQFTMAAGDYFVSGDNQSDDFLHEFMAKAYTALDTGATDADYNQSTAEGKPVLWIDDTTHKVKIEVGSNHDMRVAFDEDDGDEVSAVLGFSGNSIDLHGAVVQTADYPHAYGWYADGDGYLENDDWEDIAEAYVSQAFAITGQAKTAYTCQIYSNYLRLGLLPRDKTWSDSVGYATSAVHPYTQNEPLECWWHSIGSQGKRFRVYRYNQKDRTLAEHRGEASGGTTTTMTDNTKSWSTDPQEHAGKILKMETFIGTGPMEWYISSNVTAIQLTVPNAVHNTNINATDATYSIFDRTYETYIVDLQKMNTFRPVGHEKLDRYSIEIPLRRYEA